MKTVEQMIAEAVSKAVAKEVQELLKPISKQLTTLIEEVEKKQKETGNGSELKLITLLEARKRLMVSNRKINELCLAGELKVAHMPQGRRKIVEKSLEEYIRRITIKDEQARA